MKNDADICKVSQNEKRRLEKLQFYNILNTRNEKQFDDLTDLATKIMDIPVCAIGLIDKDRIWFKSKIGIDILEIPREGSFTEYCLQKKETFYVEDARIDQRFKDHHLVTGSSGVVFYAGIPLVDNEGFILGSLCVIDNKSRKLSSDDIDLLEIFSRTIMKLITLRREKLDAQNLAQTKDEFLSNMSHEIRTPLNAIIGFNDLMMKTEPTKEQKEYLDIIDKASQNLKVLINDILDVSKLESGKIVLEKRPTCLLEIRDHVFKLHENSAKRKGIALLSNIDPKMPAFLNADENRLTQIFINLISNSIKFTDKGSVSLDIKVLYKDYATAQIRFSIKDTGVGIRQEKVGSVFERFVQAEDSTTRLHGGTGLGLNIVKMLVELHGGKIEVKSEVNKGTIFEVSIEFEISSLDCDDSIIEQQLKEGLPKLTKVRVLLVEDNMHNQLLAKKYLLRSNAQVDLADDGLIAIEKIKNSEYDLILMDIQMPKMNGYECTKVIRDELNIDIPIIGCSAFSMSSEGEKCKKMGMNDYIAKPFAEHELIRTIAKHLSSNLKNKKIEKLIEIFGEIERKDGSDFLREIEDVFLDTTPVNMDKLRDSIKHGDLEEVASIAHFFKGSLGSLGFKRGYELCVAIQKGIEFKKPDETLKLSVELVHYLEDILEAIYEKSKNKEV